jgi:inner membrane protein
MPSLGHVAVGLAAGRLHAGPEGPRAAATALFVALATFPDADVLARALGAGPGSAFLHRGALHSMAAALAAATLAVLGAGGLGRSRARLWIAAAAAAASHGALDALTRGGGGVMFLWPVSVERFLSPWSLVAASPMGLRLASARGARVVLQEAALFAPLLVYGLWPRRRRARGLVPPTAPSAGTRARAAPRPRRGAPGSSG